MKRYEYVTSTFIYVLRLKRVQQVAPPLSVEPLREAPTEGASICDIFIPGGTQVRVLSSVIQRDPRNHADPLEFRPERWLKAEQGGSGDHFDKRAFFPLCVAFVGFSPFRN